MVTHSTLQVTIPTSNHSHACLAWRTRECVLTASIKCTLNVLLSMLTGPENFRSVGHAECSLISCQQWEARQTAKATSSSRSATV